MDQVPTAPPSATTLSLKMTGCPVPARHLVGMTNADGEEGGQDFDGRAGLKPAFWVT
jgi:hypothetical protein